MKIVLRTLKIMKNKKTAPQLISSTEARVIDAEEAYDFLDDNKVSKEELYERLSNIEGRLEEHDALLGTVKFFLRYGSYDEQSTACVSYKRYETSKEINKRIKDEEARVEVKRKTEEKERKLLKQLQQKYGLDTN